MVIRPLTTMFQWLCPPQVFDFWMERLNINRRWQTSTARVISHSVIAGDFITLVLKPNRLFSGFQVGQHISLSGVVNGVKIERCYSIANLPNRQNLIELSIKIQGRFSRWLSQSVSSGSVLEISSAWGENHRHHYDVYIAGGIGITAILPLVRRAALRQQGKPVKLIYLFNKQHRGLYRDAALELASETVTVERHDGREAIETKQWLSEQVSKGARVLSCGSQRFNGAVKEQLQDCARQLDLENYNSDRCIPGTSEQLAGEKKKVTVTLNKSGKMLVTDNHSPLIGLLQDAGLTIKKGCRQGICHQCSCQLNQGHIIQQQNKIQVNAVDAIKQTIQPCVAIAQSNIELNL